MNSLTLLIGGAAVLFVVTLDFVMATIGASPRLVLTDRVAQLLHGGFVRLCRLPGMGWFSAYVGVLVMVIIAAIWILGTALGWTLVFLADAGSIRLSSTAPAALPGVWDYHAHVGHLLSTLGATLTAPNGTAWNIVGAAVGTHGMILLTLSFSFILTTTQAVQTGRSLSAQVHARDPGASVSDLVPQLSEVVSAVNNAPFALYYCNHLSRRDLAMGILLLARRAAAEGGSAATQVPRLLADLPHIVCRDGERVSLEEVEDWARRHSMSAPPPASG